VATTAKLVALRATRHAWRTNKKAAIQWIAAFFISA
jgi:hypothetical protein